MHFESDDLKGNFKLPLQIITGSFDGWVDYGVG